MKTTVKTLIALALLGSATALFAQGNPPQHDGPPGRGGQRGPGGPGGQNMGGQRPPPSPVIAALDTNHDGVIDADEIKNASNALKTLDKNGDGKLTPDELHPPRPEGEGMNGPRGPRMGGPGGFGPQGPGPQGPRPDGPGFDGPPPQQ